MVPAAIPRRSSSAIVYLPSARTTILRLRQTERKNLVSHNLVEEFNAPELLIRPVVKAGYGAVPSLSRHPSFALSAGRPVRDGISTK
jgi:hypothetical protein